MGRPIGSASCGCNGASAWGVPSCHESTQIGHSCVLNRICVRWGSHQAFLVVAPHHNIPHCIAWNESSRIVPNCSKNRSKSLQNRLELLPIVPSLAVLAIELNIGLSYFAIGYTVTRRVTRHLASRCSELEAPHWDESFPNCSGIVPNGQRIERVVVSPNRALCFALTSSWESSRFAAADTGSCRRGPAHHPSSGRAFPQRCAWIKVGPTNMASLVRSWKKVLPGRHSPPGGVPRAHSFRRVPRRQKDSGVVDDE
jgi:hypothetical protein